MAHQLKNYGRISNRQFQIKLPVVNKIVKKKNNLNELKIPLTISQHFKYFR